jgi:hypothetical protein
MNRGISIWTEVQHPALLGMRNKIVSLEESIVDMQRQLEFMKIEVTKLQ